MTRDSSRRAFLQTGVLASVAAALGACNWDGGPRLRPVFGKADHLNDWVSARLFSSSQRAPQFPVSKRSSVFPNYYVSSATPTLTDASSWRLEVSGQVRTPLSLTLAEIMAMGRETHTWEHHCVEGWSAIATWTGLPLRAIADKAGVLDTARYVQFDSFDDDYYNGWDLASAMHPETLLAFAFNDKPLTPEHGAPLRVYAPHKLGYKLTKYLTRIMFTTTRPGGYWEDQGYPWFGGV
jgi:DMSO/TMAO reductase YedYZ molybdopterin-dependent catalytic subunit